MAADPTPSRRDTPVTDDLLGTVHLLVGSVAILAVVTVAAWTRLDHRVALAAVLTVVAVASTATTPGQATLLGLTGWATLTGFVINHDATLTLSTEDILRLLVLLSAAILSQELSTTRRSLRAGDTKPQTGAGESTPLPATPASNARGRPRRLLSRRSRRVSQQSVRKPV